MDASILDRANKEKHIFKAALGLSEKLVREISRQKNEPAWMLKKRLQGLELFNKTKIPTWGPDLKDLHLNEIHYFTRPDTKPATSWDDVPDDIKETFQKIGIPEAEQKSLAGVGAQYDSDVVYHNLKEEWKKQGVVFEDMDVAVQKYPELVKKYFMTSCIPITDHKFIMLHAAVWSGGTFIYIPKGVKLTIPLQAYFRMNAMRGGQFEHTLIIVDEGAECSYIEGCFTKGNIVTTNPDYKKIEEIKEKEKVLTSEGKFKEVKDLQCTPYSGNIYEVEVYGDTTQKIEVTEEHPFLYVDRKNKRDRNKVFTPRWNMPKFFKKKDYLCVPINKVVKTKKFHTFKVLKGKPGKGLMKHEVKVPLINEFFRLVGYYLAEGSVSSNSYLNFSFSSKEREYIDDVKRCFKKVFGVEKFLEMHHKKNNGTSVVICSVVLARLFKKFGDRCDKKVVPAWMMYETLEHLKEIILGWYRGDGNYYNQVLKSGRKELFRINTTSEKLTRQGRDILLRLGIVAFLNKRDRRKENRKTMYTVGIAGQQLIKFAEIVGAQVNKKLNGKNRASMFGIDDKFAYLPIKKVTKRSVENLPVYNFGVTDHETYTVAGVAVHNCSAPRYDKHSLHAGCVEVFVKKNARMRYSSVENWSKNTFNLNTKRALVSENSIMEWIGGNLGSSCTMLYPCTMLVGNNAKADHLSIALAAKKQNQDVGAKVIHIGKNTSSHIVSKSISKEGGISTYRGMVVINKGATNAKSSVICDALILDKHSVSNTFPAITIQEENSDIGHEASVGRISDEQLFYLQSRGLSEQEALQMIVSGFIEPIVKELPLEYAVELNKLIQLEMEGSVG